MLDSESLMRILTPVLIFFYAISIAIGVWLRRRQLLKRQRLFREELRLLTEQTLAAKLSIDPLTLSELIEAGGAYNLFSAADVAELRRSIEQQIASGAAASPGLNVQTEIDKQLGRFRERLAKIESRFPEESQIEKIASINDALLAERIDQIAKQVESLEKRTLSKWDVALTVSTIIAGIAFVVGATYAVVSFFGQGS